MLCPFSALDELFFTFLTDFGMYSLHSLDLAGTGPEELRV